MTAIQHLVLVFLLGLLFGSFANVCIYRWPRNGSIVRPRRSFCPWCNVELAWFDNIPLLSYALLHGRCRRCRSRISFRYPLVEFAMALLWSTAWLMLKPSSFDDAPFVAGAFAFLFVIVVTTVTDLDWKVIPDEATYAMGAVAFVIAPWNPILTGDGVARIPSAVLGAACGGGLLWLIGAAGRAVFGRDVMGGGDIKLLAVFGLFLGASGSMAAIVIGSFVGGAAALVGMLSGVVRRRQYIPFGPFLNLGALVTFFTLVAGASPWTLVMGERL